MLALLVTPSVLLGAGYLLSGANHLLFHAMVELFTIVTALTSLAVASTSRRFTRNHFTVFVAVVIGWGAVLDAMHVLSFPGTGLFAADAAEMTTQFWLAARLLQALALLLSPLFLRRAVRVNYLHASLAVLTGGLVLWILSGTFPSTYVTGRGPTVFGVDAAYVVIVMLLVAAAWLWRRRGLMAPRLFVMMQATLAFLVLAEFEFTGDHGDSILANELGHVFKGCAYWFVYLAVVQTTLREPFSMLSRTASTYDAIPDPVCLVDANGTILQANQAAGRFCGAAPEELVGRSVHAFFHAPEQKPEDCPVCGPMARGAAMTLVELRESQGRFIECSVAPFATPGAHRRYVHVAHDVTRRMRLTDEREALLRSLGERVKELNCLHAVSELLNQHRGDLPFALSQVVKLLPSAFVHPAHAHAALEVDLGYFGDRGAAQARHRLTQDILVAGRRFGALHVFYADAPEIEAIEGDVFLPEEQALLSTVGRRLGEAIERHEAGEKVARLTYLYVMLSATNRAITRCESKTELLAQVFDVLIRHGTFPMLFIATASKGAAPWRLVHNHGIEPGRRADLEARLAEVPGPLAALQDELRQGRAICVALSGGGETQTWLTTLCAEAM